MAISDHKTRSVFERYNIVSPKDLRDAAKSLDHCNSTTVGEKKRKARNEKPELTSFFSWCLGPESNRHGARHRGILSPLRLPIPPPRHTGKPHRLFIHYRFRKDFFKAKFAKRAAGRIKGNRKV
jgi:hypothetical protein